jgi:hypothetical protein
MYTLPYATPNTYPHTHTASSLHQHQPIPRHHTSAAAAPTRVVPEVVIPPSNGYRVPTLLKRFLAEIFDCIYIQLVKIVIVIALLNYTELM